MGSSVISLTSSERKDAAFVVCIFCFICNNKSNLFQQNVELWMNPLKDISTGNISFGPGYIPSFLDCEPQLSKVGVANSLLSHQEINKCHLAVQHTVLLTYIYMIKIFKKRQDIYDIHS